MRSDIILPWIAIFALLKLNLCRGRSVTPRSSDRKISSRPSDGLLINSIQDDDKYRMSDHESEEYDDSEEEEETSEEGTEDDDEGGEESDGCLSGEASDPSTRPQDNEEGEIGEDLELDSSHEEEDDENLIHGNLLSNVSEELPSDEGLPDGNSMSASSEGNNEKQCTSHRRNEPSSSSSPALANRRRSAPNAPMRWLLRKGHIGRTITLFCVLVWELLQTYFPTSIVNSLLALFPEVVPPRPSPKRNKRAKEATKSADLAALEQLQRLGKDARYFHVSVSFLQRHRLGPYREDALAENSDGAEVDVVEHFDDFDDPLLAVEKESTTERGSTIDDDIDWVVQALQTTKERDAEKSQSHNRIVRAAVECQLPRGPLRSPSSSSLLLGGLDRKRFSRNLFGAYPGDAVSVDEAASPYGVLDLARRYGWGDWDEEEEDENIYDNFIRSKRRRKRRTNFIEDTSTVFDCEQTDRKPPPTFPVLPSHV